MKKHYIFALMGIVVFAILLIISVELKKLGLKDTYCGAFLGITYGGFVSYGLRKWFIR